MFIADPTPSTLSVGLLRVLYLLGVLYFGLDS